MQQKQSKKQLQQETFRYKILPLFDTYSSKHILPLHAIQIISQIITFFQILKFPIDYFSIQWFQKFQPIFSFFDPTYYLTISGEFSFQIIFLLSIAFMNSYWIIQLSLFLMGKKLTHMQQNVKKLVFIVSKNVLLLPLGNLAINTHNCNSIHPFINCYSSFNKSITLINILSFFLFFIFILAQQYLNFQFLSHPKEFRRLKRSSFSTTSLLIYGIFNQLLGNITSDFTSLIVLNISGVLIIVIFVLKDEQLNERVKLLQFSFLYINFFAIGLLDMIVFINQEINICFFFFISAFIFYGTMKSTPYSLSFELENINKWHSSEIMIKYTQNLRYYMSRVNQYCFKVYLEGYIQIHKQKCDNDSCPLRIALTDHEKELFESGKIKQQDQFFLRLQNLVKKIYLDGYQQTPINHVLQLQYCIFLYEKDQKQLSLKKLLSIQFNELSFEMYYKYNFLKNKIHNEMEEEPNKIFLDLVSELLVKKDERIILSNFQKAALINLQFWSLLKEDHPNFKKLNEIGAQRIKMRDQIRQNYESMSKIVNNEKITDIYVHYLESIENDQQQYNLIFQNLIQHYDLKSKIILEDWINSSTPILLVSIEESSYATIIDLNTTCSTFFGYQRYQLLNRPVKYIFPNQEQQSLKDFMASNTQEQTYILAHKNGYLLKIRKVSKIYNSLQTGITAIINISCQPIINACSFAIRKDETILGSSSSIISLIGIESKIFEKRLLCSEFFMFTFQQLKSKANDNIFCLKQLIKPKYDLELINKDTTFFRIRHRVCKNYQLIQLINSEINLTKSHPPIKPNKPIPFEFQIQADLKNFKYFGGIEIYEHYVSQFSQLQYADSWNYKRQGQLNYAQGIKTLRLNYDIIQVIQQVQDESLQNFKRKDTQNSEIDVQLERKYEEQIFQSKSTFQKFIKDYKFARSVIYIFFLWILGLLGMYISYYLIYQSHDLEIISFSNKITYQNLIIGSIAKEESLVHSLVQMATETSPYDIDRFNTIYIQNLNYLEQIKLRGVQPYLIELKAQNKLQNYLTNEFILTFIKYSSYIFSFINSTKSQSQFAQRYHLLDPLAISYILDNSKSGKHFMMNQAYKFVDEFKTRINQIITSQTFMLIGGIIFLGLLTLVILLSIHKINLERIRIFSIFLDISQIKIQYFSSNTEKFLASLHTEDPNSEIDVDQQVQNIKKMQSSTFSKKKRLVQINFNKLIYVKFLIIPLLASIFFIQTYVENSLILKFQLESYRYFYLTSYGDYKFYSGLSQIQQSFIGSSPPSMNELSGQYFQYYREYFELHFQTFGKIHSYHEFFTYLFMNNICEGLQIEVYGSTKIQTSCNLPELSQNGSYLIFTDLAIKTSFLDKQSFHSQYIQDYQVLSQTHRLLSKIMLQAQQILINQTVGNQLTFLLAWTLIMGIISFIFGLPIIKLFIDEINLIKNIITIIPISLFRQLPLANGYLNKILKQQESC